MSSNTSKRDKRRGSAAVSLFCTLMVNLSVESSDVGQAAEQTCAVTWHWL
jgi:hypothetical protein